MRRALILLLLGLVLAGGAAVTWQAMGKAKLVEEDLTAARALLARAGGFESGELKQRLGLVQQAERHSRSAQQRLDQWPLRQLGALPLVGRDIRVAKAVAASATGTVRATRRVVTALQPVQTQAPTRSSILRASDALLGLHDRLKRDLDQVRAARPLFIAGSKTRYMEAAGSASVTVERAGQGLKLAADLYGPSGATRWFLAFQKPAELRGTGGLIGEYGILESSPAGAKLVKVDHYTGLNERTSEAVELPGQLAARYERFAIGRDWTAVNIPPDMPTVGAIIAELYERTTGDRIDGGPGGALGEGDALDLHGVVAVGLDGDDVADGLGGVGRVAPAAEGGRVLLAAVEGDRHAGLAGGRVDGDPLGRVLPGGGHVQDLCGVGAACHLALGGRAADVGGCWRPAAGTGGRERRPSCGRPQARSRRYRWPW